MPINPIGSPVYNIPPQTIINILPPEVVNIIFGGGDTDVQVLSTASIAMSGNGTPSTPIEAILRVSNNPNNKIVIIPMPNAGSGVYVAPPNWNEIIGDPEDNTNLLELLDEYQQELLLEIAAVDAKVGDTAQLNTVNKSSAVAAINEVNTRIAGIVGDNIAIKLYKTKWFTLY